MKKLVCLFKGHEPKTESSRHERSRWYALHSQYAAKGWEATQYYSDGTVQIERKVCSRCRKCLRESNKPGVSSGTTTNLKHG